jgi:hypothetical protein
MHAMQCRMKSMPERVIIAVQVTVVASFLDSNAAHCTCTHEFKLPLALFAQLVPPLKCNTEKLTVVLNQSPASLLELFQDVAQSSSADAIAVRNPSVASSSLLCKGFLHHFDYACLLLVAPLLRYLCVRAGTTLSDVPVYTIQGCN